MTASKKILAVFLAAGLVSMLFASLYQRFTHPSLTVSRFNGGTASRETSEIGQLMELAARNPKDARIALRLAEQLMAIGQWQSAENFVQRALATDSGPNPDPRAMYLLAVIHHNQGRHKEAAELLEKLLAKTENPSARYSLGILYLHFLHEPAAGISQLEKGLAIPGLAAGLERAMREELAKGRNMMPQVMESESQNEDRANGAP